MKQTYNNNTIPNINLVQPNVHSLEDLQYQNNTKIKNLEIQNTTNNNTNKIIGIFAKKGQ